MMAGLGDAGGMNVYIREMASSLAQIGFEVTIFVRRWSSNMDTIVDVEPGVRVVHVTAGPVDLRKESLPAVVDEFAGNVGDWLTENPADVLHANYWLSGLAGHCLKHDFGLPLVSTFHTLARVKAFAGELESVQRISAEEEVMACSDAITVNSSAESQQLVELYGVDPEIVKIVRPGVSRKFFKVGARSAARAALGLDEDPVLLFVGRIQPLKGACLAAETLAELDADYGNTRLLIVGGASGVNGFKELQRLKRIITDHKLEERVELIPAQPHEHLVTYFQAADACLMPSRSESFGFVALEAAACGIPVVAANVGGLASIVRHNFTGYLLSERSSTAYAEAVRTILGNPLAAAEMGSQAAQLADSYSWAAAADKFKSIVRRLVSRACYARD